MLEVNNLGFHYRNGTPVLRDVSFSLDRGDILCLLGPNGTGKTTLLSCLLGLRRPQVGSIVLDGADLARLSARERSKLMAYVPQSSGLSFSYEVREVVMMGRVAHLAPGAAHSARDRDAVMDSLERLQIAHLAQRRFPELSGGEKQMVLVARAMVQQAKYLIMDEPTANLDYSNQIRILRAIRSLSEQGYGVLMTSHDPDHAFLACSQTLLMRDGYVMCSGTPDKTVTTESLTRLYGTPVAVSQTLAFGAQFKVCVPMLDISSAGPVGQAGDAHPSGADQTGIHTDLGDAINFYNKRMTEHEKDSFSLADGGIADRSAGRLRRQQRSRGFLPRRGKYRACGGERTALPAAHYY